MKVKGKVEREKEYCRTHVSAIALWFISVKFLKVSNCNMAYR